MTYTVIITSLAGSNRSKARDNHTHRSAADKRTRLTVRMVVLIGSATVAVIAAGVAGCAVAVHLRTVTGHKVDDVKARPRPTGTAKSATVLRRSLSVTADRHGTTSTCQTATVTARHPVSVAWADCTLSPVEDEVHNDQRQHQQQTTVDQHQFRMTIFPAACCAYD